MFYCINTNYRDRDLTKKIRSGPVQSSPVVDQCLSDGQIQEVL